MKKFVFLLIFSVVIAACGTGSKSQSSLNRFKRIQSKLLRPVNMEYGNCQLCQQSWKQRKYLLHHQFICHWGTFSDASNDKAELKVKFVIDKDLLYQTTAIWHNGGQERRRNPIQNQDYRRYREVDFTARMFLTGYSSKAGMLKNHGSVRKRFTFIWDRSRASGMLLLQR